MSRPEGAGNRGRKDGAKYLRRWLERTKRYLGLGGCSICGRFGWPRVEPKKLVFVWLVPDQEDWSLSRGPQVRGMTLERLKEGVRSCRLVCRSCVKGGLRRDVEDMWTEGSLDVGRFVDPETGMRLDELYAEEPPRSIVLGKKKYK